MHQKKIFLLRKSKKTLNFYIALEEVFAFDIAAWPQDTEQTQTQADREREDLRAATALHLDRFIPRQACFGCPSCRISTPDENCVSSSRSMTSLEPNECSPAP